MKFITILDDETNDVLAQLGEDESGDVSGVYAEGITVIVDGKLITDKVESELAAISLDSSISLDSNSTALDCTCGAGPEDLDLVKNITTYLDKGNIDDVEIEYKLVCSKCGQEGDLAPNKNGAVLSWNENILKEKMRK